MTASQNETAFQPTNPNDAARCVAAPQGLADRPALLADAGTDLKGTWMTTLASADDVFRLMYRSRNQIPEANRKVELGELFSVARAKNKALGVSGALVLKGDWFVQILEGEESAVRGLLERIEADTRHDSIEVLEAEHVAGRVFARWAMAKVTDTGDTDIALIAHADGIAPAAPRGGVTPEQEGVLKIMRDAARA